MRGKKTKTSDEVCGCSEAGHAELDDRDQVRWRQRQ